MSTLNKTLFAIFALQLAILGATQFAGSDRLAVQRVDLFPGLEAEKVSRIDISGPSGETKEQVVLARKGEDWVVDSAEGYPAKASDVEDLLSKLAKLVSRNVVLESSRYHEKLEVTDDAHQRKVILTVGGEPRTFFLGSSPKFKNTHVRFEAEDQVVLAPVSTSDFGNRAWNWVERSYVEIPKNDVWRIEMQNEKGSVVLERDPASGAWSSPDIPDLAQSEVDTLLGKLTSVRLEEPVGKTEAPEYGLSAPVATVALTVGTSTSTGLPPLETKKRTLRVGASAEGKSQRFVKFDDETFIVRVSNTNLSPILEKGPEDFASSEN
ncbi:MAG: DUF4340 domain-containing protein [Myxococcota bacterium]